MFADFRYALRLLIKSPGFSAVAILTLALGIGANTAIFSVVEGTLLRPLPFPSADRLFRVYEATDDNGARGSSLNLSDQTVRQWREHGGDIFDGIAAATGANVVIGAVSDQPAQNVQAARIDSHFLSVLKLSPAMGRNFSADEDRPGGPPVTIISHDFWRKYLGQSGDVVGTTITIDGIAHTIVGVMPKTFRHPYRADLWLPLALPVTAAPPTQAVNHYLYGVVRLRPGISVAQADNAIRRMCSAINQAAPSPNNARAAYMPPLRESFVMDLRPKILVIVIAAFCALVIAAANFAGLLLSRVVEREGECALRAALGANWTRLVRQQLAQALVLAAFGTIFGLLIASWITPTLVAMSPEGADATGSAMREFDNAVRLDWPVFAFATGTMLVIGLVFGLLPAVRASRTDLRSAMSSTARGSTLDRGTRRLLGSLVVIELAVAAALLMSSLAAAQYFRKLINEPWGFATDRRVAFNVTFSDRLFPDGASKEQAIARTLAELSAVPGVRTATGTVPSPMNAPRDLITCNPEGATSPEPPGFFLSYLRAAPPGYFKSIGQPLLQGREFLDTDGPDSPQVCVVSDSFARRFWPNQNPIGKRVKWGRLDGPRPWLTVAGVVGDMKAIADPRDGEVTGMVARPLKQILSFAGNQIDEVTFVVETSVGRASIDPAIRSALARTDSRLAAYQIVSLEQAAFESRVTERFIFVLVSLFGVLGLALAAVGLYGLLALQVARREREFGIRSALGATAAQIIKLVAQQGATLLGIGFVVAGFVTWCIARLLQNQWSALPAPNLVAWLIAGIVLLLAAAIACWLPARRAARVDPVVALRAE